MLELHVCNQQGEVLRAFALGDSEEVIIGRDETCDIRIRAKTVSREHCTVEREGQDFVLRDLGSTGGTFLNGQRQGNQGGQALTIGDKVSFGGVECEFVDAGRVVDLARRMSTDP